MSESSLGTATLALQAGGVVSSAIGDYGQSRQSNIALEAQANAGEFNAQLAKDQAEQRLRAGNAQVGNVSLKAGQMEAAQRTAMAANGIAVDSGSARDIQKSTQTMKNIDMQRIQEQALYDAWGYRMQGVNYRGQAAMDRASKGNALASSAGSLLGGAGKVASSWYNMKHAGA